MKVGEEFVAPSPEAAAKIGRGLPGRRGPRRDRHRRRRRPHHHGGRRLPGHPALAPDRLRDLRGPGRGREREGLPGVTSLSDEGQAEAADFAGSAKLAPATADQGAGDRRQDQRQVTPRRACGRAWPVRTPPPSLPLLFPAPPEHPEARGDPVTARTADIEDQPAAWASVRGGIGDRIFSGAALARRPHHPRRPRRRLHLPARQGCDRASASRPRSTDPHAESFLGYVLPAAGRHLHGVDHRADHRRASRLRHRAGDQSLRTAVARDAGRLRHRPARRGAFGRLRPVGCLATSRRSSCRCTTGCTTTSARGRCSVPSSGSPMPPASRGSPRASCWRS